MRELAGADVMTFVLVGDLAAARTFYEETLGLPVTGEDAFAITFALANGARLRLTSHAGHVAGAHTVLGWSVPDIHTSVEALVARGVSMLVYEGFDQDPQGVWTAPDGTANVAWFADPAGNVLSLTQYL